MLERDGTVITVPLERLSAADQQYIQANAPKTLVGKVVNVVDGDTLIIVDEARQQYKIRLEGIDAPETAQPYSTQSREALSKKVFQQEVKIKWKEKDKYGRILGQIYLDGHWVNNAMLEEGWAWHYKYFSKDQRLAAAEVKAREGKAGLWASENPMPPWEFRNPSLRKPDSSAAPATAATPPAPDENPFRVLPPGSPEKPPAEHSTGSARSPPGETPAEADPGSTDGQEDVTVYVTKTGKKYHRDGCRYLSKSKIPMSLSEAARRYSPCSVCGPPQPKSASGNSELSGQASTTAEAGGGLSSSSASAAASGSSGGRVQVKGYYRKDGTYVKPHTRSKPKK